MKKLSRNRMYFLAILIAVNLIAHFLPFERAALAPDDYASLVRLGSVESGISAAKAYAGRPLSYAVLNLQSKFVGDNTGLALILLFISASVLLIAVYLLLERLFRNEMSAFAGAVIFCLIPNKLETYHTLIYFNMNLVSTIYLISLVLFVDYTEKRRIGALIISVILYGIGIFWYEVGFFAPLFMFAYCIIQKKGRFGSIIPYAIAGLVYAVYRLTGAFGLSGTEGASHSVSFSMLPANLKDLFHHYAGRYMLRSIVYGVYNYVHMRLFWLVTVSILSVLGVYLTGKALKERELPAVVNRRASLGAIIFLVFILPILLNDKGGVGGRHLVLPSVGISLICIWLLQKLKWKWKPAFMALILLMFIVSAGNAWTQVVACRINGAVFGYLKSNRPALEAAKAVVIDTKSFADRIKYTLVERDFNLFNTYYGAQAFEDWGLISMVRWVTRDPYKTVYISVSKPFAKGDKIMFCVYEYKGYRSKSVVDIRLPSNGTLVIGAKEVFGGDPAAGIKRLGIRI